MKLQKAGPSYSHTSVLEVARDCSCWLSPLLPKLEATRAPLRSEQTRTQVRPHEGMLQTTKEKGASKPAREGCSLPRMVLSEGSLLEKAPLAMFWRSQNRGGSERGTGHVTVRLSTLTDLTAR